jgi:hypothetical protein
MPKIVLDRTVHREPPGTQWFVCPLNDQSNVFIAPRVDSTVDSSEFQREGTNAETGAQEKLYRCANFKVVQGLIDDKANLNLSFRILRRRGEHGRLEDVTAIFINKKRRRLKVVAEG